MLDTNVCIFFLQGKYGIKEKIQRIGRKNCCISEMSIAELLSGAASSQSEKHSHDVEIVLENLTLVPIYDSLPTYAATKAHLRRNGQLIENFSVRFENGRAVSCRAEKGQELLEKMIGMDEGAAKLGEIALVPKESPVNACGFLFYNTLFDENACCHVALGQGFKEVLPSGENLSVEEAAAAGINDSIIHVDFMVGADDLAITGVRGKNVHGRGECVELDSIDKYIDWLVKAIGTLWPQTADAT